jgi:hypothetical protein
MGKKKGTKVPQPEKRNETTWGEENPPPVSPGRPRKDPDEPVLEEGYPVKFAAIRAALGWDHEQLPKHLEVRIYVEMRRRSIKEFMAEFRRLEGEWEQSQKPASVSDGSPDPSERVEDPVGERVVEDIEAWLEKHRLAALARAEAIERGERA